MAKPTLPAGIRLRGEKYFVDVTVNGKRKTSTCSTLEEALARREELKGALATGKGVDQRRANARVWTLQEALDKTLSLPKPEGWRGSSYESKGRINVESACLFMGPSIPLDQIDRELIDEWVADCEAKGNSDSTVNRKLSALRKVFEVAKSYGGVSALPNYPKNRKEKLSRIRQISREEEQQLLRRLQLYGDQNMADAVTLLLDTGMRASELLNVWKQDYQRGDKGRPDVLLVCGVDGKGTKNGEFRSVPLTERSSALVKRRIKEATGKRLFDMSYEQLRQGWDRVRHDMGMMDDAQFTLHVTRHTCVSRLVRGGVPLPTVQKWAGHKTINTTMRYAHLYPADLFVGVDALERGV